MNKLILLYLKILAKLYWYHNHVNYVLVHLNNETGELFVLSNLSDINEQIGILETVARNMRLR